MAISRLVVNNTADIRLSAKFRHTCRLLTQFPLSVAIETSDATAIVSTTVVDIAIQRERNCTTLRRDS